MKIENERNKNILERASQAVVSRDFEQAERIYKNLLINDPDNTELLDLLGSMYLKSGEDDKALSCFNQIIRLRPNDVVALNHLGGIYRRQKKYDESIKVLTQAVVADETNVQSFYNLGFTYKIMERYDDALKCFDMVVKEKSDDVLAYNHIGSIYALKKQHREAVSSYLRGLKIDPNHPILRLNLAKSYDELGDFERAQSEYEAALKTRPGWLEAIESYADLLLRKNKSQNAKDLVNSALKINSEDVALRTKLGDVFRKQSDYDSAEHEYTEALSVSPNFKGALSGLADTYEQTGRNEDALGVMTRMETSYPDDDDVLRQYAHVLLSADREEEARKKIISVYEKTPEDVHTLNLLGQYYICVGDERKALGCYKKIRSVDPSYTEFYVEGGKRYSQKGMLDKAEEFYSRYIEENPESVEGLRKLAENYEAQGKFAQALSSYGQIKDLDSDNKSYKSGLDRVNRKVQRGTGTESDLRVDDEFSDADEDFSVGLPIAHEEESSSNQSEILKEDEKESSEEEKDFDFGSDFTTLQEEEIPLDDVFEEGRLDEESVLDSQEQYSNNLDDLVPEKDFSESESGLEEDEESVDDFFAQNPFGSDSIENKEKSEESFEPDFKEETVENGEDESVTELEEVDEEPYTNPLPHPKKSPVAPRREDFTNDNPLVDDALVSPVKDEEDIEEERGSKKEEDLIEEPNIADKASNLISESSSTIDDVASIIVQNREAGNMDVNLFQKLRSLCDYLPSEQRKKYLESKERLQLEYVISRLSDKQGFLSVAKDMREELGDIKSFTETESGKRLLQKFLPYVQGLVSELKDEGIVVSLNRELSKISSMVSQ